MRIYLLSAVLAVLVGAAWAFDAFDGRSVETLPPAVNAERWEQVTAVETRLTAFAPPTPRVT